MSECGGLHARVSVAVHVWPCVCTCERVRAPRPARPAPEAGGQAGGRAGSSRDSQQERCPASAPGSLHTDKGPVLRAVAFAVLRSCFPTPLRSCARGGHGLGKVGCPGGSHVPTTPPATLSEHSPAPLGTLLPAEPGLRHASLPWPVAPARVQPRRTLCGQPAFEILPQGGVSLGPPGRAGVTVRVRRVYAWPGNALRLKGEPVRAFGGLSSVPGPRRARQRPLEAPV